MDISQQIEADISAYLLTITAMNAAVGIAAGVAMYLCGLGDRPLVVGSRRLHASTTFQFWGRFWEPLFSAGL
nr:hypothetical protein [Bradyrhizobium sp. CCBAU 11361]